MSLGLYAASIACCLYSLATGDVASLVLGVIFTTIGTMVEGKR